MDRMSPTDASFLHIEDDRNHMHIGSVGIFEGPPPEHHFGPDSYRVGLFTGQGITQPGLSCDRVTPTDGSEDIRACNGFLESAVDGAMLDVSLADTWRDRQQAAGAMHDHLDGGLRPATIVELAAAIDRERNTLKRQVATGVNLGDV